MPECAPLAAAVKSVPILSPFQAGFGTGRISARSSDNQPGYEDRYKYREYGLYRLS